MSSVSSRSIAKYSAFFISRIFYDTILKAIISNISFWMSWCNHFRPDFFSQDFNSVTSSARAFKIVIKFEFSSSTWLKIFLKAVRLSVISFWCEVDKYFTMLTFPRVFKISAQAMWNELFECFFILSAQCFQFINPLFTHASFANRSAGVKEVTNFSVHASVHIVQIN